MVDREKTWLFMSAWESLDRYRLEFLSQGNKLIADTVRLMLGGGTFLFILSGSIFNDVTVLISGLKVLLVISWALIMISFIAGIMQLISDSSFLGRWAKYSLQAREKIQDNLDNEKRALEEASKVFENKETVSNMLGFWIQVLTLGIALLIQIAIVSIHLFINS